MTDENQEHNQQYSAEEIAEMNEQARGRTPRDPVERQDLGEARLRGPDKNWPSGGAMQSAVSVPPTRERLARKSQTVSVRNSSDRFVNAQGRINPQTHIVFDRYQRSIQLQPGETKHNVEMLVADIDYFVRLGMAGRKGDFGQPLPRHPVEIIGVDAREIERQAREDHRRLVEARERAEKARHEFAQHDEDQADEHGEADHDDDEGSHEERSGRRPLRGRSRRKG